MKVAICAGGTGGHMFPSCALFHAMKNKNHDVVLITDTRGNVFCSDIDNKIVLKTVRFSVKRIFSVSIKLFLSVLKFVKLWWKDTPDVVIGFGGMFTVIPLYIAKMFGAKVIICEQNAVVGRANIILEKIASLKLSTFDIDDSWTQVLMPVRKKFEALSHEYRCNAKIKILVIGGSQGAKSFSKIIPNALSKLNDLHDIEIVQQVNEKDMSALKEVYENIGVKATLLPFIYNIAEIMSDVQLVICRSGASTLSELSEMGIPAVLIPYPYAAENHQYKNALHYEKAGAVFLLTEENDIESKLADILDRLLVDRNILQNMANNMKSTKMNKHDLVEIIEQNKELFK